MRYFVGLLALVPAAALAHEIECPLGGSDGQRVAVTASTNEKPGEVHSNSHKQYAHWLCCNQAAGACDDFDSVARAEGNADFYIVSLEDINTCTNVDVDIGNRIDASGVNHTFGTLTLATTQLRIPGPALRHITAVVNVAAGCALEDEVDVRIDSYYARGNFPP